MSEPTRYRSIVPYPKLDRLTMAVSVLVGLCGLACLFAVDFIGAQLTDLPLLRDGFPVSDLELAIYHARMAAIGRTVGVLALASAILWLIWQYRAHANLRAIEPTRAHVRPAMSVVMWLIPVLNAPLSLWAIRELWRVGDPDAEPARPGERRRRRWTSPLVWAWWITFFTTVWLAVTGLAQAPRTGASPEELIARDHWLFAAALVGIAAAVLAIVLVNSIVGRLQRREYQVHYGGWEAWSTARIGSDGPVGSG
jgi:hypothetical protein